MSNPFIKACMNGDLATVKKNIDPHFVNSKYNYGKTALHTACDNDHVDVA